MTGIGWSLEELRRIAQSADDGGRPWGWWGGYPQSVVRHGDSVVIANTFEDPDHPARLAEFIATFDPPTVLAMIALLSPMEKWWDGEKYVLRPIGPE